MAQLCVQGAILSCSFGVAPSGLQVTSTVTVQAGRRMVATIQDHVPMANILPFGMCSSPANPAVVAALGPAPCVPVTPAPWMPGAPAIRARQIPVLHAGCTLNCIWAGLISVRDAGQTTVAVR